MKNIEKGTWFIALSAAIVATALNFASPANAADPEFSYSGDD